ncbi:MAG: 2-dehydropantoate 2-reductase [Myxococcota bacterium]
MSTAARIAWIGLGAIGGVCGARLVGRQPDLVFCVRTPVETLVVDAPDARWEVRPQTLVDPSRLAPADWVVLSTKAHQVQGARPWLDAAIGEHTRVAVIQNGVEHAERVSRWVPAERVVPVVIDCPAERIAPGHVVQRRRARLQVPTAPDAKAFAAWFADTDLEVECVADPERAAWEKLAWNAASGAVAALAGRPLPEIDGARRRRWCGALATETVRVAAARGIALDPRLAEEIRERLTTLMSGGAPSTLADRLAGRPLEVEARNGAVVRIAEREGLSAPANQRAAELLRTCHEAPSEDWLPEVPPPAATSTQPE